MSFGEEEDKSVSDRIKPVNEEKARREREMRMKKLKSLEAMEMQGEDADHLKDK